MIWKGLKKHRQWFEKRQLLNSVAIAKRLFPELAESEQPIQEQALLRIEVLGSMRLVGQSASETLRGRKRLEMLAVLLEAKLAGSSQLAKLELFDRLYPEEDELKASNNLRELVYVLRQRLGEPAIVTTATSYALGNFESDAEQFLKTGDTSLWRGAYLEGISLDQHSPVAESLYLLLFTKAQELLEINPKEIVRVGKILLEYDPYNKDYLKLCMQALRASNNHKSLTRLYIEAKERFTEVGETLPEQWKVFLL
jgi:two-component SAPR family response regulator